MGEGERGERREGCGVVEGQVGQALPQQGGAWSGALVRRLRRHVRSTRSGWRHEMLYGGSAEPIAEDGDPSGDPEGPAAGVGSRRGRSRRAHRAVKARALHPAATNDEV